MKPTIEHDHDPESIRLRLASRTKPGYLGDAVLGAIDGSVTTFAVVAGAVGAEFPARVALILGMANLLADGFSMAVSNYQAAKSNREQREQVRLNELSHIEKIPEGEREEIRQIFAAKGFSGETLEKIVSVITDNQTLWVDTMLTEEFGFSPEPPAPLRSALTTFLSFLTIGLIPLIPLFFYTLGLNVIFIISATLTSLSFFAVGLIRGHLLNRSPFLSGINTFLTGGAAAMLAYVVGYVLRNVYGPI